VNGAEEGGMGGFISGGLGPVTTDCLAKVCCQLVVGVRDRSLITPKPHPPTPSRSASRIYLHPRGEEARGGLINGVDERGTGVELVISDCFAKVCEERLPERERRREINKYIEREGEQTYAHACMPQSVADT
jgi:hypothetical protein